MFTPQKAKDQRLVSIHFTSPHFYQVLPKKCMELTKLITSGALDLFLIRVYSPGGTW